MAGHQVILIDIEKIKPNANNPRGYIDEDALQELANSIKENGVISPIIVAPSNEDFFSIIAGERRWRASQIAGLNKIPAMVMDKTNEQLNEIAILENLQRVNLNPMDEAKAFKLHLDQYQITYKELAQKIGKSESYISTRLKLLDLPIIIQINVNNGILSISHAKELARIDDANKQEKLAFQTIENGWSAAQLKTEVEKAILSISKIKKAKQEKDKIEQIASTLDYPRIMTTHEFILDKHAVFSLKDFDKYRCESPCENRFLMISSREGREWVCKNKECRTQRIKKWESKINHEKSEAKNNLIKGFRGIIKDDVITEVHWRVIVANYLLDLQINEEGLYNVLDKLQIPFDTSKTVISNIAKMSIENLVNLLLALSVKNMEKKLISSDYYSEDLRYFISHIKTDDGSNLDTAYMELHKKE